MNITKLPEGALNGPVYPEKPKERWNKIIIIGEAPGRQECINGIPFSGPAGELLNKIIKRCDIERKQTFIANVFLYQPYWTADINGRKKQNDISNFFTLDEKKADKNMPKYRGKYVLKEHSKNIKILEEMISKAKPKFIIACGSTALWAMCHIEGIKENRGKKFETKFDTIPVFPTYHTAYSLHRDDPSIAATIEKDIRNAIQNMA